MPAAERMIHRSLPTKAIVLGTVARRDNSFDDAVADDVTNSLSVHRLPRI
jgi:hypothetical protein